MVSHVCSRLQVGRTTFAALLPALFAVLALPNGAAGGEPQIVGQEASVFKGRGGPYDSTRYRIEVPENRSDPESRDIELAVLQVKSNNPDAGPPIFCLAGGPGGSSIALVKQLIFMDPKLLQFGDLVGVDQRGIGESSPTLIFDDIEFTIPYEEPGDPEELLAIVEAAHKQAYARLLDSRIDPAGYNTEESADDINDVRRLLGYDTIRILGGSYGSHLAFSTVRRHGEFVERVVIESPEGPDHTFKRPAQMQEGLELLAERVSEDKQLSQHIPDLLAMVEAVLKQLEKQPVFVSIPAEKGEDEQTIGISKFDAQRWIASSLGRVSSAREIPAACYEMSRGDFSRVAEDLYRWRGPHKQVHAMAELVDIASWASDARFKRIEQEADETLLGDTVDFPSYQLASAWGRHLLDDEFRSPLRTDVPFLFVVGDLDARTPPSNAREILEGLPNGHLVTVVNTAHDFSAILNRQTRKLVHDFLQGKPVTETQIVRPPVRFTQVEEPVRSQTDSTPVAK